MRWQGWAGLAAALWCSGATAAAGDTVQLRLHGSNTVGSELAPALVQAWAASMGVGPLSDQRQAAEERRLSGAGPASQRWEVDIHSHGSSTGFADLLAGRSELWMSSRPVRRSEVEQARLIGRLDHPTLEHVIALDGLAVVVSPGNPLAALDLQQLRDLFTGRIRNWSQLGGPNLPVHVYARDERSGTWDTFSSLVLDGSPLASAAQRYESNAELTAAVAADDGGIGFTGLAAVGSARPIAVHAEQTPALLPDPHTVATEDYLLARRLFLYHAENASEPVRQLVDFALSPAGQAVVERVGYVALQIRAVPEDPRDGAPAEYQQLVTGADRLSVNFRFGSGLSLLDSKAERDIQRLVEFMAQPQNAGRELVVAGFADSSEGSPFFALSISNDRVDYVAERLARAGLNPRGALGFGQAVPVAPNSSEVGRLKNRRVEVWLR